MPAAPGATYAMPEARRRPARVRALRDRCRAALPRQRDRQLRRQLCEPARHRCRALQCNMGVKFTDLLGLARELGAESDGDRALCPPRRDRAHGIELHRPVDASRDQSWFPVRHHGRRSSHYLRFPLGDMPDKSAVRAEAQRLGLAVAAKPDSQDLCFVPGRRAAMPISLRACAPDIAGERRDRRCGSGRVLGTPPGHRALHHRSGQAASVPPRMQDGDPPAGGGRRAGQPAGRGGTAQRCARDEPRASTARHELADRAALSAPLRCTVQLRAREGVRPATVLAYGGRRRGVTLDSAGDWPHPGRPACCTRAAGCWAAASSGETSALNSGDGGMPDGRLVIGTRRYSSWSLRGWLAVHLAALDVEEQVIPIAGGRTEAIVRGDAERPGAVSRASRRTDLGEPGDRRILRRAQAPALWPVGSASHGQRRAASPARCMAASAPCDIAMPMNCGRQARRLWRSGDPGRGGRPTSPASRRSGARQRQRHTCMARRSASPTRCSHRWCRACCPTTVPLGEPASGRIATACARASADAALGTTRPHANPRHGCSTRYERSRLSGASAGPFAVVLPPREGFSAAGGGSDRAAGWIG